MLGDLTKGEDIARVVAESGSALGPIDILVHNAGGDIAAAGGKPDPNDAVNIKEADVRAVLERNLLSTILTCQAVARGMMERRRGRIVTIGSVAAFKGRTNSSIYAVAKAGVTHYTRCLADQLRTYDIAVNCIAPGDTRTGRFLGTRAVDENRMVETGTLDRIATVDEVARVVEVFAGPAGRLRFGPGAADRRRRTVLAGMRSPITPSTSVGSARFSLRKAVAESITMVQFLIEPPLTVQIEVQSQAGSVLVAVIVPKLMT